jgi:hypothetical protein
MSNKTRIALLLAIAIAPASAMAAAKHPAHQPSQAVDQHAPATAAYARDNQTPRTGETYIWLQDQSVGLGD